jgi:hypothetical protein
MLNQGTLEGVLIHWGRRLETHGRSGMFQQVYKWVYNLTNTNQWGDLPNIIELDDGKFYRKTLYLMVKTMVSCRFALKPIH